MMTAKEIYETVQRDNLKDRELISLLNENGYNMNDWFYIATCFKMDEARSLLQK